MASCFVLGAVTSGSLLLAGCDPNITDADLKYINTAQLRTLMDENENKPKTALVLDAREPEVYKSGHLPGAANLRAERGREHKFPKFDAYKTLVVYAENPGSGSSRTLAKRLMALGYGDVKVYAGGMAEWRSNALPASVAVVPLPK